MPRYGIYDKQDNCWLGNEKGPNIYEDFTLARLAAIVVEDRVHGGRGRLLRYEARELPQSEFHFKDEIAAQREAIDSLRRMEMEGERNEDEE